MFKRLGLTLIVVLTIVLVEASTVSAQDEPYAPEINPANFVEGVNHLYFTLTPGTTHIYSGVTEEGVERIQVSVLDETREVLGIPTTVVRDTVWIDGELFEDTVDWYAQDKDGNVWYMGEETAEYEDGVAVSSAGSWEAGVDGALPGIIMEANPQVGDTYRQEYYAGEAEDMAEIISVSDSTVTAFGVFEDVLVTNEWNPFELGKSENKYYAAGIGLILEEVVEGGTGRIELIAVGSTDELASDEDSEDADEGESVDFEDADESSEEEGTDEIEDAEDEIGDDDDDGELEDAEGEDEGGDEGGEEGGDDDDDDDDESSGSDDDDDDDD